MGGDSVGDWIRFNSNKSSTIKQRLKAVSINASSGWNIFLNSQFGIKGLIVFI